MSEREASGDFDYLFEDVPDESSVDALPDTRAPDIAPNEDDGRGDGELGAAPQFDAFDSSTWYFEPAPPPWYRTKQTLALFVAASVAAVALVVSSVLLALRGPDSTAVDETTSVTQPAASTPPASRPPSRTSAPPPPPPPPPAETSAAPAAPAPVQTNRPRAPSTRTTKEPEIGVTRTPATRSPISVAPQRPGGGQR
ncbi:hypothetical protein ABGB19_15070 [Mycobacterium sp. B14F4]|uniref:hypothetical protein n=1 Tax=Mycobacterium sp. B14F4 TaxID=3153565 RepID=UPI00325CE8B9